MDIGTDKSTSSRLQSVPHHCIDIKDPDDYFSAGEYGRLARRIIEETFHRNRIPIVVGGSGLYIRALVDGVFSEDARNIHIRERLKEEAEAGGLDVLYQRLSRIDPDAVQKIHAHDMRRIIRALEVYELTGEPISRIQKDRTVMGDFTPLFWSLRWERDAIYQRIEERVDRMIESGLVDEVTRLRKMGYGRQHNSMDSVGYKEIFDFLDGQSPLDETINLIKQNTRRFAKKQMTWFRRDARINWIDVREPVDWDELADTVLRSLDNS